MTVLLARSHDRESVSAGNRILSKNTLLCFSIRSFLFLRQTDIPDPGLMQGLADGHSLLPIFVCIHLQIGG